jgi:hypothetical protein
MMGHIAVEPAVLDSASISAARNQVLFAAATISLAALEDMLATLQKEDALPSS